MDGPFAALVIATKLIAGLILLAGAWISAILAGITRDPQAGGSFEFWAALMLVFGVVGAILVLSVAYDVYTRYRARGA